MTKYSEFNALVTELPRPVILLEGAREMPESDLAKAVCGIFYVNTADKMKTAARWMHTCASESRLKDEQRAQIVNSLFIGKP